MRLRRWRRAVVHATSTDSKRPSSGPLARLLGRCQSARPVCFGIPRGVSKQEIALRQASCAEDE